MPPSPMCPHPRPGLQVNPLLSSFWFDCQALQCHFDKPGMKMLARRSTTFKSFFHACLRLCMLWEADLYTAMEELRNMEMEDDILELAREQFLKYLSFLFEVFELFLCYFCNCCDQSRSRSCQWGESFCQTKSSDWSLVKILKLKSGLNLKKSMLLAIICLTTAFLGVPSQYSSDTDWLAFC